MEGNLNEIVKKEILDLVVLLDLKIDSCEDLFRNKRYGGSVEEEAASARDVVLIRSLRHFSRYAKFLGEKVNDDSTNAQFYLSQLRTITEIAVKLVYILSADLVDVARVIVCGDLISLKKISHDNYVSYFNESKKLYKRLLFDLDFFPQCYDEFSKSKLKTIQKLHKVKLLFPEFKGLVDNSFLIKNTPYVSQYMVGIQENMFNFTWNNFSEHVHGNHLLNEAHGNESFWINSHMFVLLGAVIEVSDRNILGNDKSADVRLRFQETNKIGGLLLRCWKNKQATNN